MKYYRQIVYLTLEINYIFIYFILFLFDNIAKLNNTNIKFFKVKNIITLKYIKITKIKILFK